MERFKNPVQTCGWCLHPMEMHIFEGTGPIAVPCAHCPDNVCDTSKANILTEHYADVTIFGGNDCD